MTIQLENNWCVRKILLATISFHTKKPFNSVALQRLFFFLQRLCQTGLLSIS